MKRLFCFCLAAMLLVAGFGQTLFTYGKSVVTKDEFLRAFNKNPGTAGNRKEALKEYLDLYINFKLKVRAAYDAKLQDDATQVAELSNFRLQIADNIINEEAKVNELVQEAFERSKKDVHLAQVFIELPANGDTIAAFKNIQAAYNDLKSGKDFNSVSIAYSTDLATKESGGDLGFITVFTLPYQFETVAYKTAPNTFSMPFRSALGYHIFKNIEERAPLGSRKIAQILITFPPNASIVEKSAASAKADSVYALLKKGRNFGELVRAVSNDMSSLNSDGVLGEFGIGTYNPTFEQAAYALKEVGEISKPVASGFGYHILQLVQIIPVGPDKNNVETLGALQEKVIRDDRLEQAKKAMIDRQIKQIGYKPAAVNQPDLWKFTDSLLASRTAAGLKVTAATPVFYFAKQTITANDWVNYVKATKASAPQSAQKTYTALMQDFVSQSAAEYYRNHLDDYSAEYKQQVKEFKDANLLFGIMDANVWSKANNDSAALQQYYEQHKEKYMWQPSADALVVTCTKEGIVEELQQRLKRNPQDWRTIIDSYSNQATADSGRYELGQLPVTDCTNFTENLLTAPVKNQSDKSVTFNYIVSMHKGGEQRSFDESRGIVISDYQQVLEDRWIEALKTRYPVKVNMAVFDSIK